MTKKAAAKPEAKKTATKPAVKKAAGKPAAKAAPKAAKSTTQRASAFGLNPTDELHDLRMSEKVDAAVRARQALHQGNRRSDERQVLRVCSEGRTGADRWTYAPGQLEVLNKAKDQAKKEGLWNFFLPDAETGEGLSNLDYAYIAAELGKNPLASETHELLGAGHRQHGSAGARWHAGAKGKVAQALAERRNSFGLCDDRSRTTPRRMRRTSRPPQC